MLNHRAVCARLLLTKRSCSPTPYKHICTASKKHVCACVVVSACVCVCVNMPCIASAQHKHIRIYLINILRKNLYSVCITPLDLCCASSRARAPICVSCCCPPDPHTAPATSTTTTTTHVRSPPPIQMRTRRRMAHTLARTRVNIILETKRKTQSIHKIFKDPARVHAHKLFTRVHSPHLCSTLHVHIICMYINTLSSIQHAIRDQHSAPERSLCASSLQLGANALSTPLAKEYKKKNTRTHHAHTATHREHGSHSSRTREQHVRHEGPGPRRLFSAEDGRAVR